jgi:transposase
MPFWRLTSRLRRSSATRHERLKAEHRFAGGYTVVKDYVRIAKGRSRETFVPLTHPPGHAQVDFGEAIAVIGGVRQKIHVFFMDLPHSDAAFMKAFPAETTEAFSDGHVTGRWRPISRRSSHTCATFSGARISLLNLA